MKIINIDVIDKIDLKNIEDTESELVSFLNSGLSIPASNYNNILLNFNFISPDATEEGLHLFAIFSADFLKKPIEVEITEVEVDGEFYKTACLIPAETLQKKGNVTLGIYGYVLNDDDTLNKRISLSPIVYVVNTGSYSEDALESTIPTPTAFEVYFNKVANMANVYAEKNQVSKQLNDLNKTLQDNIDSETIARKNATNVLQADLDAEATTRESLDSNLQSQINSLASGSPLVASSTSEMTDTSRVYVNTTDGKWYYYNGSNWVSGGVYQSTGIANNSITPDHTNFIKLDTDTNLFDGKYTAGAVSDTDGIYKYVYSDYVEEHKSDFVLGVVKIEPNTAYTIIRATKSNVWRLATHSTNTISNGEEFDGNVKLSPTGGDKRVTHFTTGENDNYLYFQVSTQGVRPFVQLVKGTIDDLTVDFYPYYLAGLDWKNADVSNVKKVTDKILSSIDSVSLPSFGISDKNIVMSYDKDSRILRNENPFNVVLGRNSKYGLAFTIPQFEISLKSFEMITVNKEELLALSGSTKALSTEHLHTKYYYNAGDEGYNPDKDILLFWCSNNKKVYTGLGFDIETLNNDKLKIAWFGDSISKLKLLPHRVADIIDANIYDCSVAGSVMDSQIAENLPYEQLGFKYLSQAIVSGDYSIQEQAVTTLEETKGSDLRENFNTLIGLDFNNIDAIVVLYGTNDYIHGVVTIDDYKQSMSDSIKRILTAYPHIKVYVISPMFRTVGEIHNNPQGKKLTDYVTAEQEVCNSLNIPFFDLYHNSNINSVTAGLYLQEDGLHQTDAGDILLADKCAKFINNN